MTAEQNNPSIKQSKIFSNICLMLVYQRTISPAQTCILRLSITPKSGKAELVGYRASRNINVTVTDLADLNQYLDMALKAGINQVDNIN